MAEATKESKKKSSVALAALQMTLVSSTERVCSALSYTVDCKLSPALKVSCLWGIVGNSCLKKVLLFHQHCLLGSQVVTRVILPIGYKWHFSWLNVVNLEGWLDVWYQTRQDFQTGDLSFRWQFACQEMINNTSVTASVLCPPYGQPQIWWKKHRQGQSFGLDLSIVLTQRFLSAVPGSSLRLRTSWEDAKDRLGLTVKPSGDVLSNVQWLLY